MVDGAWETPFGDLEIHSQLAHQISDRYPFEIETATRFNPDNTIELQLPFLKYFFREVKIVPMGVPPVPESLDIGADAVQLSQELGLSVKVVGSTDLTHYGLNYGMVSKGTGPEAVDWVRNDNDRRIIDAMQTMMPERVIDEALEQQNACCAGAAATAIAAAKTLGAQHAETLAYATSYDRSPGDSFVGYVGMVFH
jgi:AmmeMemoRadiSam system protein B